MDLLIFFDVLLVTGGPCVLEAVDGGALKTGNDLHHGVIIVELLATHGNLNEPLERGRALLDIFHLQYLCSDPPRDRVEALDHGHDVGRLFVSCGLLGPGLAKALPRLNGFVEAVFNESKLTCDLQGIDITQFD